MTPIEKLLRAILPESAKANFDEAGEGIVKFDDYPDAESIFNLLEEAGFEDENSDTHVEDLIAYTVHDMFSPTYGRLKFYHAMSLYNDDLWEIESRSCGEAIKWEVPKTDQTAVPHVVD